MSSSRNLKIWMSRTRGGSVNSGFAMVELIFVIAVSAFLAIYANQIRIGDEEESIARGGGMYLKTVAQGVERHILLNFPDLAAGNPVAGTANPLQPTIPELIALTRLNTGFPIGMPTRQIARVDITRTGCPGATCQITSTVCTTTPVRYAASGPVRFDLAYAMVDEQKGSGGQSRQGDGANIRGPSLNVPNPMGNVEGIVCGSSYADVGIYDMFVKMRDTRDPDLQGNLSVAGDVNAKQKLNVGTCINMDGTPAGQGRAGFACADRNDLPGGYTGGVRSVDVVGNKNILASSSPGSFTGNNTNYALLTTDNGLGVAEIRTSGRSAGDRLTPLGSYAPGTACTLADEGSIAKNSTATGLVNCEAGVWVALRKSGVVGQPCSPDGAMGTSPGGLALYCQSGIWTLMADRFGRFATTDTYLVHDNSTGLNPLIPVPNCPASGVPKIYFNPQGVDSRSTQKANFRADVTTNPGFYTIHVDDTVNPSDPYGTPSAGYGLLVVGCFYN